MTVVKWNPWSTLPTLQDRINRLFDEVFPASESREDVGLFDWRPVVDTYEKDDAVVIKAELPGVKKEDITIDVRDNVLILKGERTHDKDIEEKNYHRRERFYGRFQRSFSLPEAVDPEKIEASYKDGILEVKLPKLETKKAKKIEIK